MLSCSPLPTRREIAQQKDYSEETAIEIDSEIKRIVLENYDRAKEIIVQHLDKLHRLATTLLEKEVLGGEEVDEVLGLSRPPSILPPQELNPEARPI